MKIRFITILFLQIFPSIALASGDFKEFEEQLKYLAKRDRVISQNIANADTPGYLPKDLKKNVKDQGIILSTTNPNHIGMDDSGDFDLYQSEIHEMKPNGNGVSVGAEMQKKSENAMSLSETMNIYNKARAMIRTAITGVK